MSQPHRNVKIRYRPTLATEFLATLSVTLYSIVVTLGFVRIFSGWDFAPTLIIVAIIVHTTAFLLRYGQVPVAAAVLLTAAVTAWSIGWLLYGETYSFLLPTGNTWDRFNLDLDLVGERFGDEITPVPFLQGWDVLSAIGVGLAAIVADTFAFHAYARAEALVPGGVLFVFISALGSDRARIVSTVALIAAGLLTTIALRIHHAPADVPTVGRRRANAARVAVPGTLFVIVAVATGAAAIGPRLPGADAEPLYDPTTGNGGLTTVISPLVDIRSRLTNRSDVELFLVEATADSYWRSSTLAKFDGRVWELPERSLQAAGDMLSTADASTIVIRQRITITNLGGSLVPAAANPVTANPVGAENNALRFHPDSATLVKTGGDLSNGDRFDILSAAPRFTPDELRAAEITDVSDPVYLEIPDDFPRLAVKLSAEVTAGTSTVYDAALALQNWMRKNFRYSLEIQEGHSNNAIESFLVNRIGYCEQFAGAYAAMMRSLGHASRVAVGFTPGLNNGDGQLSVFGKNAHAWPEIWFGDLGWVPFEPTPGRGAPGSEGYTGVPPQQDLTPVGPTTAGGEDGSESTPSPTTIAADSDATSPTTIPPTDIHAQGVQPDGNIGALLNGTPTNRSEGSLQWASLGGLLLVGGVVAAPSIVRRIRRRRHGTPIDQLGRLWDQAMSALLDVGISPPIGATPIETARRTGDGFPPAGRPMEALAGIVTEVTYAPQGAARLQDDGPYGTSMLGNCRVWTRQIDKLVTDSLSTGTRLKRYATRWR